MPRILGPTCALVLLLVLCSLLGTVNSNSRLFSAEPDNSGGSDTTATTTTAGSSSSSGGGVPCSDPPEHCKGEGEPCKLRTISECIPPFKCLGSKCTMPPGETASTSGSSSTTESKASTEKTDATQPVEEGTGTGGEGTSGAEGSGGRDASADKGAGGGPDIGETSDGDGGGDETQVTCGEPPVHCKPKGATCKLAKVSECAKGLKCDKDTKKCVVKGGSDSGGDGGAGDSGGGEGGGSSTDSGSGSRSLGSTSTSYASSSVSASNGG